MGRFGKIVRRIGVVLLWPLVLACLFVGFNKNDPYLISLRGGGNVVVCVLAAFAAFMLIWRGYWNSASGKVLILLWCLVPLAFVAAHVRFEFRKHDVLHTEASTAHRLGRHFVVGYSSFDEVATLAEKGLIAGVYVTRHNLRGKAAEALASEIAALQARRHAANLPPLIVAADQEGGIVSHLAPALTELPALSTLVDLPADLRDRMAEEYGRIHGRELAMLGVNLNFAPVLDLRPPTKLTRFDFNTLIGRRAISGDPARVADVALPYIRGLEAAGVGATVKHFPGLGRVRGDTHHFSADLDTPLDELASSDWRPFREALAGSRAMLMVGHVRLTAADPDRATSHSKKVIDGIIRREWNYRGVVITDDLVMGAIYQHDVCTAVVEALNAGVDLLLVAFDGAQFYRIFSCALVAAGKSRLDPAMLAASEARLEKLFLRDTKRMAGGAKLPCARSLDRAASCARLQHRPKTAPDKETQMAGSPRKPDMRLVSGPGADGYADMVARARALIPDLRERAPRTEALRRLPPETERALHDAGLFRILQPKRVGGSELDYVALVDCADALGQADASVAWNFANLSSHHWMLGMFDPRAQDAVWKKNADTLIASSFIFPAGRARKTKGGYTLNGHWPFSSGVESCEWNMLAGVVETDDEADGIEYRIFLLHRADYKINDTWNATGLGGTGSNDVKAVDAFVADHMSVAISDLIGGPTPGSVVNPNPLYALPVFSLFPYVLSGVALGNAQACLDDYVELARHRASTYNRAKLGDMQTTQIKIAEASAKVDAARLLMRTNCIDAMADARRGHVPDIATKTRMRRDGAFSVNLCTEAVSLLFTASGARSLFTSGTLQRQFRDAHAVNSHLAFNFDAAGTNYGRVALGLPSENLTL